MQQRKKEKVKKYCSIKEQTRSTQDQKKKKKKKKQKKRYEEIVQIPEKKFRIIMVKMFQNLENRRHKMPRSNQHN